MTEVYDQGSEGPDGLTGGDGRQSLFRGEHTSANLLCASLCDPLATLIENLRQLFRPLYPLPEVPPQALEDMDDFQRQDILLLEEAARTRFSRTLESLKTSARVIAAFDKALDKTNRIAKPVVDRLVAEALSELTVKRHMQSSQPSTADCRRHQGLAPPHESR